MKPPTITEAVIRPVASLPSPELQTATWKLVEAASPKCGPTVPVASKIARVIKNAIETNGSNGTNGNGHKPRNKSHPSRERPFVQAAQRLSAYNGFDAGIVTISKRFYLLHGGYFLFSLVVGAVLSTILWLHAAMNHAYLAKGFHLADIAFGVSGLFTSGYLMSYRNNRPLAAVMVASIFVSIFAH